MKSCLAIEHLAKFEQRRQLKKGRFVSLFNTSCVQNLPIEEKKEFFAYLKRKKRAPKLFVVFLILSILGIALFSSNITGFSIIDNKSLSMNISIISLVLFIAIIITTIISLNKEKAREVKFERHIEIAERRIR